MLIQRAIKFGKLPRKGQHEHILIITFCNYSRLDETLNPSVCNHLNECIEEPLTLIAVSRFISLS